jgi:predicted CoA-binding protein
MSEANARGEATSGSSSGQLSRAATEAILARAETIAVVGISDNPERPSWRVAQYLSRFYEIVPVSPRLATWEGRTCYPSLLAIPPEIRIDIVDIFRRSDAVPPIVQEAIQVAAGCVWMQIGVKNEEARRLAEAADIPVIMNRCIKVVHSHFESRRLENRRGG